MVVKFSTKEAFQSTPDAKLLHELVVTDWFHRAATAALLRYQDTLTENNREPATNFSKLCGAREFLGVLLNMTAKIEAPKPKPSNNLDHNA